MTDAAEPTTTPTPAAPRQRRLWLNAGLGLIGVLLFGLLLMVATLWWTTRSEAGTACLLRWLPYVTADGVRGALWGDFEAQRLDIALPGTSITLRDVGWRGLDLGRSAAAHPWLRVTIAELHAASVAVVTAPSTTASKPLTLPGNLRLPVQLDLAALRIGTVTVGTAAPLRDVTARGVQLGGADGSTHRVDGVSLAWDKLRAEAALRIGADAPFPLTLTASVAPAAVAASSAAASASAAASPPSPEWRAEARLTGPLQQPTLDATLRARADAQHAEQALDVHAGLRPFAAWPLGELQAGTRNLDLSALMSSLPATSLTGEARAQSSAADQPSTIDVKLSNALPGKWNEARLPVKRLAMTLRGQANRLDAIDLTAFDADLGNATEAGGSLHATGRWTAAEARLDAVLKQLRPDALDARAPAMTLGGSIGGVARQLATAPSAEIKAEISGALAEGGAPQKVQLSVDAALSAAKVELRRLLLEAGSARASASGSATHADAAAPWLVKGKLALASFDPSHWWPGGAPAAWKRGETLLNASADVDLSVPPAVAAGDLWARAAALRGTLDLDIAKSQLAGVPLLGSAKFNAADGKSLAAKARLEAAGNVLSADGQLAASADGAADQWSLSINATALERLAPLVALLRPAGKSEFGGSLTAEAHLDGRWPAMKTNGRLDAGNLKFDNARLQRALATWQLDFATRNGGFDVDAALTGASLLAADAAGKISPRTLDNARLTLKGTPADHRLELNAQSVALPPAWADTLVAAGLPAARTQVPVPAPAASATPGSTVVVATTEASASAAAGKPVASAGPARSVAHLVAKGSLTGAGAASAPLAWTGWRGSIGDIELRSSQASALPWLRLRDVALAATWAEAPSLTVEPGRADVLGGALRWSRIAWQAGAPGTPGVLDANLQIEPLRVAPILARLQPDFGWGGDLVITGHAIVKSAPGLTADIVIERQSGDLVVTNETGTQAMGLSDLRFGIDAHDGTWSFTQGVAGRSLGVASGALVVRTTPDVMWPPPSAPLQGVIELKIGDLGTLSGWVPTGWRLNGALGMSATFAGTFGAPEYVGKLDGSGLRVRNFLQGVDVHDGDVAISLQGDSARIERFSAKAGKGSLTLSGNATLGDAPVAALTLVAEQFQLLGRVDRRIVTSGRAQLKLDKASIGLDGNFGVDEGLIDFTRSEAPTLSDDVQVVRRDKPSPQAVEAAREAGAKPELSATPATRNIAMNLKVGLGDKLRLKGHGIDTGLRGDLVLTAPKGELAVNGSVSTSGGTYAAYGQKLTIDRGLVAFSGQVANPRLDIEATRPGVDIRVGVQVTGYAVSPRVRLFSVPDLSDTDKLSWLVLGRAPDGLGGTDAALLQRAALAIFAGDEEGVSDRFTKAIGLDELSLGQSTEGDVKGTVITLGKQISKRWYVGYERGLNATAGTWQLIYRLGGRFRLRAQSGDDTSFDAIWSWRWQ